MNFSTLVDLILWAYAMAWAALIMVAAALSMRRTEAKALDGFFSRPRPVAPSPGRSAKPDASKSDRNQNPRASRLTPGRPAFSLLGVNPRLIRRVA